MPLPDRGETERRSGKRRRGGRPRSLTRADVDWALDQVWYRARKAVADDLNVDRRTLDRRLAERRAEDRMRLIERRERDALVFRCDQCGARGPSPACGACGHIINPILVAERALAHPLIFPDEEAL